MNITKIGLLIPSSTIFPIGKDFDKGLKKGLGSISDKVEIHNEFIGQGNFKKAEDAVMKFIDFYDVDIVTGILSGIVTEYIAPKFANKKKPLLISELGECFPNPSRLNEFIFVNSHHIWQHAWALGNWAVKNIGKKGMFVGGVYDAGYSFSQMFYEGMISADSEAFWSFSVPPNPPPGKLSDMSVIFQYLEQYQPDFVFATFCGGEATLFLNEFISKGWHEKTQLLGLPFLLAPFHPLVGDISVYTTLPDAAIPQMKAEETFYNLGYRAGAMIAEAAQADSIHQGLLDNSKTIQLGGTNYILQPGNPDESITIAENIIQANETIIKQNIIATTSTLSLRNENLSDYISELQGGWQNPYLCI